MISSKLINPKNSQNPKLLTNKTFNKIIENPKLLIFSSNIEYSQLEHFLNK